MTNERVRELLGIKEVELFGPILDLGGVLIDLRKLFVIRKNVVYRDGNVTDDWPVISSIATDRVNEGLHLPWIRWDNFKAFWTEYSNER